MKELSIISKRRLMGEPGYVHGVKCYFNLMGLATGQLWSTTDYMNWLTDRQNEFRTHMRKDQEHPNDFWGAFDTWLSDQVSGDTYVLYQPAVEFAVPLSALKKWGLSANDTRYNIVWSGKLKPDMLAQGIADELVKARPAAYKGRAVAVGDVIVLSRDGHRTAWFYDTDGLVQINGFEKLKWKSKNKKKKGEDQK